MVFYGAHHAYRGESLHLCVVAPDSPHQVMLTHPAYARHFAKWNFPRYHCSEPAQKQMSDMSDNTTYKQPFVTPIQTHLDANISTAFTFPSKSMATVFKEEHCGMKIPGKTAYCEAFSPHLRETSDSKYFSSTPETFFGRLQTRQTD